MQKNQAAIAEFWRQSCKKNGIDPATDYYAGPFSDPELANYQGMLLDLVREGKKQATARLDMEFEKYGIARRGPGDLWIVLDTVGDPACLVRITDLAVWPFDEVPLSFAQREGEGDNSLEYWRWVHKEYFVLQLEGWGDDWRDDLATCCEGFDLVEMA